MSEMFSKSDLPFSHGFRLSNYVFTSGQVGVNPETGELAELASLINNLYIVE